MRKRIISWLAAAAVPLSFMGGGLRTLPAQAASGDLLRTITVTPAPDCSPLVSVGVAFDGSDLIVSCVYNDTITLVDPSNGNNLGSIDLSASMPLDTGIGAMAWDADVGQLWLASADGTHNIYSAVLNKTLLTGVATFRFTAAAVGGLPIVDGLAYDGTDKTIWYSPDVSDTIYHFTQAGTLLGSHSGLTSELGGCGNSGIAVASATALYLANDGCSQIWATDKAFSSFSLFASTNTRLEDLECDNADFSPLGALWSKDAYDWVLRAFEVPAGQCAQGGVVQSMPTTVTLTPAAAIDPVNTNHTVTATVRDQSNNLMGGVTVYFTVTRTPGGVTNTGTCVTSSTPGPTFGTCTFTYHGPILPATDVITGCAGTNGAPPCGVANKTWVLPVSNPLCTIDITNGGWMIANDGDKVNFGGSVHTDQAAAPSGQEQYADKPADTNVHSIDITAVTCSSNLELADIYGHATINGSGSFVFRIEVSDPDSTNGNDTYWIILDNGYDSGSHPLGGGTIEIHKT